MFLVVQLQRPLESIVQRESYIVTLSKVSAVTSYGLLEIDDSISTEELPCCLLSANVCIFIDRSPDHVRRKKQSELYLNRNEEASRT